MRFYHSEWWSPVCDHQYRCVWYCFFCCIRWFEPLTQMKATCGRERVKSGPRGVASPAETDIWFFTGNGGILFSSSYPRFKYCNSTNFHVKPCLVFAMWALEESGGQCVPHQLLWVTRPIPGSKPCHNCWVKQMSWLWWIPKHRD